MTTRCYPNPFSGRPKPVELSSCFLLSPMAFLKLAGLPPRVVWQEMGGESVMKSFEYHLKRGQEPSERLAERVLSVLPEPVQTELRRLNAQREKLQEHEATEADELLRPWATFLRGHFKDVPTSEYPYASQYLLALERALVRPVGLLRKQQYEAAANVMSASDVLREILSPEMTEALRAVTSSKRFVFVHTAIAIEVALSHFGAWGASLGSEGRPALQNDVLSLVAGNPAEETTPLQAFFGLLLRDAGVSSQVDFANYLMEQKVPVDLRTLQRWSSGKTMPVETHIRLIARVLRPSCPEHVLDLYFVVRYLTLLGYASEVLRNQLLPHMKTPGAASVFAPWHPFPFKCESFTDWLRLRYPVWFDYHSNLIASGVSPLELQRRTQNS